MKARTAKIFMNGRSQAVRLPKEFRFDSQEVYISQQGQHVILSAKKPTWDDFFNTRPAFDDGFLAHRHDLPPQDRVFD